MFNIEEIINNAYLEALLLKNYGINIKIEQYVNAHILQAKIDLKKVGG